MPQTVPEEQIQPAKAAFGTVETIAEFAGPALATALVLGVGPGFAFAIDAATFLVSAAFLVAAAPARARGRRAERTTVLEGAAGGLVGGARAHLGVGDHRRVLARAADLVRPVDDARADGVDRALRHARACTASSPPRWAPARSPAR